MARRRSSHADTTWHSVYGAGAMMDNKTFCAGTGPAKAGRTGFQMKVLGLQEAEARLEIGKRPLDAMEERGVEVFAAAEIAQQARDRESAGLI